MKLKTKRRSVNRVPRGPMEAKKSKDLHPYAASSEKPEVICDWEYPKYSMVPLCILHDNELIHTDIRVYGHLRARCIDKPFTWVSQNTIAKCIGVSKSSVHNSYTRLESRGLIHITRNNKDDGKSNSVSLIHPKLVYGEKTYFDWDAIWADVKERKPKFKKQTVFGRPTGGVSPIDSPVQPVKHPHSANTSPQREKEQRETSERYEIARSSASTIPFLEVQQPSPSGRETQQEKEEEMSSDKKQWGNAPRALHRHFQTQTEQKFGFSFVPNLKSKHIKMWDLVLQRLGSLEAAMGLIRFTCEQWEELRDHYPSLTDQPSVELFASGWLDVIHGKYRALQNGFQIKDRLMTKEEADKVKRSQELLDKYTIR